MNKKIVSVLMTAAMLVSAVPAMATTEGIVQGDILLISENPVAENTFEGVVSAIDGQLVTITIDGADYTFGLAEGIELEGIAVGDTVSVTSTSSLMTKDIKPATSIIKAAAEENAVLSYNRYEATVSSVGEGIVDVVVEGDMVVTFATTDNTAIYSIDGEKADAVKEGDKVIILSTSSLMTKDIKEAAAIVITKDEANTAVYLDTFKMTEEGLLSADGEIIIAMEGADKYDGKKLLVFYDFATMSIPAITNPIKVVELEAEAEDSHKVSVSFKVGDSTLTINGEKVTVETPYVVGTGVTLVPIRVISEAFGAEVDWDGETKTVTVSCGECKVIVTVGSKTALVNGEEKTLEEAPELTDGGFSMIPLRFISESLGATVGYDNATAQITVEK